MADTNTNPENLLSIDATLVALVSTLATIVSLVRFKFDNRSNSSSISAFSRVEAPDALYDAGLELAYPEGTATYNWTDGSHDIVRVEGRKAVTAHRLTRRETEWEIVGNYRGQLVLRS